MSNLIKRPISGRMGGSSHCHFLNWEGCESNGSFKSVKYTSDLYGFNGANGQKEDFYIIK